jgi:ribosomal-protein-alanine N-acetyltransferase
MPSSPDYSMDFPVIETPHYVLRRLVADDIPEIFRGLSDPRVTNYYGISYDTLASTQAQMDWFELIFQTGIGIWWGICDRQQPQQLLGTCGLHEWDQEHHCSETGFWLFPEYWGKGVMRESLPAMFAHCFQQLGLHRIQAMVEPENIGSWRLLESFGFQLEGILRECEYKNGHYVDLKCYSLLAHECRSASNAGGG